MKSVSYLPRLKQSPDLFGLAEKASHQLDDIVGMAASRVEAEWDAAEDEKKQNRQVMLTLRYLPEEYRENFTRADLENSEVLNSRILRLWMTLLRDRSHRLLREYQTNWAPGDN